MGSQRSVARRHRHHKHRATSIKHHVASPNSNKNPSRRLGRVAWKLLGASLYYGLMLSVGMVQSKSVLCRLCRTYLKQIKPLEFWILFTVLTCLFFLLDCVLLNFSKRMMFSKQQVRKSRSLLYPNYKEPKYTRSGTIYGYM